MELEELIYLLLDLVRNLLALAGVYALIWWCIDHLISPLEFAFKSITPYLKCNKPQSLDKQFGQWAIVTGSTDGIGKQLAMELAKKGLNICLIARTQSKLIDTANEIERKFKVKTMHISVDFSHGAVIYDNLRSQLKHLDIGILVNNVGRMYDYPNDFDEISEDLLWDMININIGAVTMISRIVIPQMKLQRRGLIVNISSGCETQPMPLSAVYGATKSYTRNFTLALSKELEDNNVKVHLVTPMFVRTNMISFSTVAPRGNCFIPTPEQYARATINKIDKCSQTCGYWLHGVQHALFNSIPEFMRILIAFNVNKKFREQYHEQRRVKHFEI